MTRAALALLLSLLPSLLPLLPQGGDPTGVEAEPVRGTVVDEAGRPLAGVRWWVSGHETLQDGTWILTHFLGIPKVESTGADGRFELPGRSALRYDVDLDADGHAPAFLRRLEAGSEATVVLRRGHTVTGRVVQRSGDRQVPLEHVTVALQRPNERGVWFESRRTTSSGGRFVFQSFLPPDAPGAGAPAWRLMCAGASLELEPALAGPVDDLLVEIAVGREGR